MWSRGARRKAVVAQGLPRSQAFLVGLPVTSKLCLIRSTVENLFKCLLIKLKQHRSIKENEEPIVSKDLKVGDVFLHKYGKT